MYRLNDVSDKAIKTTLVLGEKAGRYIELVSGANVGEQYIISDLSNYQAKEITIN